MTVAPVTILPNLDAPSVRNPTCHLDNGSAAKRSFRRRAASPTKTSPSTKKRPPGSGRASTTSGCIPVWTQRASGSCVTGACVKRQHPTRTLRWPDS